MGIPVLAFPEPFGAGRRRVDPLRAKKLHVLAACEVERHRKRAVGGAGASRQVMYGIFRGFNPLGNQNRSS